MVRLCGVGRHRKRVQAASIVSRARTHERDGAGGEHPQQGCLIFKVSPSQPSRGPQQGRSLRYSSPATVGQPNQVKPPQAARNIASRSRKRTLNAASSPQGPSPLRTYSVHYCRIFVHIPSRFTCHKHLPPNRETSNFSEPSIPDCQDCE